MTPSFESELAPVREELTRRFGLRAISLGEEPAPAPGTGARPEPVAPLGEAVPVDAAALLERGELRPLEPLPALEALRAGVAPAEPTGPTRPVLTLRFEPKAGEAPDLESLAQYLLYALRWRPPELRVAGGGREASFRSGALMMDLELYRRFRREQKVVDLAREARLFLPTVEVERWSVSEGLLSVGYRCAGGAVESALGLLAAVASEPLGVDHVLLERVDRPGEGAARQIAELMAPTAVEGTLSGAERELFVPLLRPVLFPSFAGLYRELLEDGIFLGPIRLEERRDPACPVACGSFLFDRAFEPHEFEIAYRDEPLAGAGAAEAAVVGPEGFEQILLRANGCTYRMDAPDVWRWPTAVVERLLARLVRSERPFLPSPVAGPARIRSLRAGIGGARAPAMVRAGDAARWEPFLGMRALRGESILWLHAPPQLSGAATVQLEVELDKPRWALAPRGAEPMAPDWSAVELKITGASVPVDAEGRAVAQRERAFVRGEAAPISVAADGWRVEVRLVADPAAPAPGAPILLVHLAPKAESSGEASKHGEAARRPPGPSPEQAWFSDPEPAAPPPARAKAATPAPRPAPRDAWSAPAPAATTAPADLGRSAWQGPIDPVAPADFPSPWSPPAGPPARAPADLAPAPLDASPDPRAPADPPSPWASSSELLARAPAHLADAPPEVSPGPQAPADPGSQWASSSGLPAHEAGDAEPAPPRVPAPIPLTEAEAMLVEEPQESPPGPMPLLEAEAVLLEEPAAAGAPAELPDAVLLEVGPAEAAALAGSPAPWPEPPPGPEALAADPPATSEAAARAEVRAESAPIEAERVLLQGGAPSLAATPPPGPAEPAQPPRRRIPTLSSWSLQPPPEAEPERPSTLPEWSSVPPVEVPVDAPGSPAPVAEGAALEDAVDDPAGRPPEPPTVVASLDGSRLALELTGAAAGPPQSVHLEDLDAPSNDVRLFACVALPLGETGLSLAPDGALSWKSDFGDWALGALEGRVVLRTQSRTAGKLQWTGEGGSRALRAGETARLRTGDLLEYAGRRWRVHARGDAEEILPPKLVRLPPEAPPRARAEPMELAFSTPGKATVTRAVAIPGGKLGLALGADGAVLWQTRDPAAFRIWVGVDRRLILLRPPVAPPITLVRGKRSLEVPPKKPVVLMDQDLLVTSHARVKLTVLGTATAVQPPWAEEPLADADEVTPIDPPHFDDGAPAPGPGEELEGPAPERAPGAVTQAAVPAPPRTVTPTPAPAPAPDDIDTVAWPWKEEDAPSGIGPIPQRRIPTPARPRIPSAKPETSPGASAPASPRKGEKK